MEIFYLYYCVIIAYFTRIFQGGYMTGNGTKIRCRTRSKGYSLVNNVLLRDKRITPKARHIGIFMLSQSDEWDFNMNGLCSVIGMIGKDSLRSAFRELENFGYLERIHTRKERGYYSGYEYILTEEPNINETVESNCPASDNPTTDDASQEKTTLIITNTTNYKSLVITNNINGVVELVNNLGIKITNARIKKLIEEYTLNQVIESIQFAILTMPSNPRTKEGYIISCIQNRYTLSVDEKHKLFGDYEKFCLIINQQEQQANLLALEENKLRKEKEITSDWWEHLSKERKKYFWQKMIAQLPNFLKAKISKDFHEHLNELPEILISTVVNILNDNRKELN